MKICNNCNRIQPESATICSNCGRASFIKLLIDINNLDEEVLAAKERKRKKKTILALLICFVAFLLLILITVIKVKQDADNNLNSYSQCENTFNITNIIERNVL